MFHSRCAATAMLFCIAGSPVFAQDGIAYRTSLGTALAPAADGTPRYAEDSGWNSASFTNARWAVEYGSSLSATPWIAVLRQPSRANAGLTATANQLTLDLAGGTYSIQPFLANGKVQGGLVTIADTQGTGAYLRITNGTLNNDFGGSSSITVGDRAAVGRMFVKNGYVRSRVFNVGSTATNSAGFLTLETGSTIDVLQRLAVGKLSAGNITLSGANTILRAGFADIGGATTVGVITLNDPTALFHVTVGTGTAAGDLWIDNKVPAVAGANAGLVVNAGTVLIDDRLLLATSGGSKYGAVEINGGRVAVNGTVEFGPDSGDTVGGKVFLNDGRLEVASPTAFRPNANKNFYWKDGTLAFTEAATSLTDVQLKSYTRQGALSYGGTRAEGTVASGQTLEAAGSLTLTGNTISLAGGTLRAGDGLVVNAPIAGYGTLDGVVSGTGAITNTTTNDLVIGGLNGVNAITSTGDVRVGRSDITATYAGVSNGGGRFIKEGSATQSITGSVLNTGGVAVTSGNVQFSGAGSTLQTSSVNVADGAGLRFEAGAIGSAASAVIGTSPAMETLARLDVAGTGTTFAVSGDVVNNGIIELAAGSLSVGGALINHGHLINNGTLSGAVSGSGVLSGSGVYSGPVVVETGAMLAPGNSPGTATFDDLTLAGGSTFEFEIADAAGVAGVDWDLASIAGTLTIAATSADPMTILLKALDPSLAAGVVQNFDPSRSWTWKFISAAIANPAAIDLQAFAVDASGFESGNGLDGGTFSAMAADDGIYISFAPQPAAVPEPGSLFLLSSVGLATCRLRSLRRRFRPSSRTPDKALAAPRF